MAMPYFINPRKSKWSRDWTGAHKHVGMVKGHKRHVNPKKKARRKLSSVARAARTSKRATRRRVRRFSAAQLAAQRAFAAMARARSGKARSVRRAASVSTNPRRTGGTVAKKKRRRSVARNRPKRRRKNPGTRRAVVRYNPKRRVKRRRNPGVRRGRVRHRRNPGFSARGVLGQITRGAMDGLTVTLGSGLTNYAASKVPVGQTTALGRGATQIALGLLGGMIVRKVTRSDRAAAFYVAGAFQNVLRPVLAGLPVLGPALGSYYRGPAVGSYYRGPDAGLSGFPTDGFALKAGQPGQGSGYVDTDESDTNYDESAVFG